MFREFKRIQEKAGGAPLGKDRYGFHDLRRAFATMNADKLTADALRALMQHQDYQTTQRYINMPRQLKPALQRQADGCQKLPSAEPIVFNENNSKHRRSDG